MKAEYWHIAGNDTYYSLYLAVAIALRSFATGESQVDKDKRVKEVFEKTKANFVGRGSSTIVTS